MKIIDTNNHGDIILWQHDDGKRTIRTSAGSILVQGRFSYVMARWLNFKNT